MQDLINYFFTLSIIRMFHAYGDFIFNAFCKKLMIDILHNQIADFQPLPVAVCFTSERE